MKLKNRRNNPYIGVIVGGVIGLIIVGLLTAFILSSQGNSNDSGQSVPVTNQRSESARTSAEIDVSGKYSVHSREDISGALAARFIYMVILSPGVTTFEVEIIARTMIQGIQEHEPDIDEVIIEFYSEASLIGSGWDVGRAVWSTGGELGDIDFDTARYNDRTGYDLSLDLRDDLEKYLKQRAKSEFKYGLPEATRRQIFSELVRADDRASSDADKIKEEVGGSYFEHFNKLRLQYKLEVLDDYGVDEEVGDKIIEEGFTENWPMPREQ